MAPTYSNGQEMVSIYLIKIKITTKFFKSLAFQFLLQKTYIWKMLVKFCAWVLNVKKKITRKKQKTTKRPGPSASENLCKFVSTGKITHQSQ